MPKRRAHSELYYAPDIKKSDGIVQLTGEEQHHLIRVTRHKEGDEVLLTDGRGCFFRTVIMSSESKQAELKVLKIEEVPDPFSHITLAIPLMKNSNRFEFALEKSIELGFTQFRIYRGERSVAKGFKENRWEKIALAAMKQSLGAYLPKLKTCSTIKNVIQSGETPVLFDLEAEGHILDFSFHNDTKYLFLFGPEGGWTETETASMVNARILRLSEKRLRTETAVITAASLTAGRISQPGNLSKAE